VVRYAREEPLVGELRQEWNRSLGGDGQARAHWRVVEGGHWSWHLDAVCVRSSGPEWSAYQYSRVDPQVLRALRNFVIEVTVSGSAAAAGLSFGPYKDFLVELQPETGQHLLQLEVDTSADTWAFRVDGRLAKRSTFFTRRNYRRGGCGRLIRPLTDGQGALASLSCTATLPCHAMFSESDSAYAASL